MELRTYTNLWRSEKRLYKFYDINLPYPISVKQVGIFLITLLPWLYFMSLTGIGFEPPFGQILWLAPPFLITWAANRPIAEGKTVYEFLSSQISFFFSPKTFAALTPTSRTPVKQYFYATVWRSKRSMSE